MAQPSPPFPQSPPPSTSGSTFLRSRAGRMASSARRLGTMNVCLTGAATCLQRAPFTFRSPDQLQWLVCRASWWPCLFQSGTQTLGCERAGALRTGCDLDIRRRAALLQASPVSTPSAPTPADAHPFCLAPWKALHRSWSCQGSPGPASTASCPSFAFCCESRRLTQHPCAPCLTAPFRDRWPEHPWVAFKLHPLLRAGRRVPPSIGQPHRQAVSNG